MIRIHLFLLAKVNPYAFFHVAVSHLIKINALIKNLSSYHGNLLAKSTIKRVGLKKRILAFVVWEQY